MSKELAVASGFSEHRCILLPVDQHIVEIVSDSGEGAQTCGQMFGALCAKSGFGVWTVEIIPAEIEPPARSRAGASGNRIRIGSQPVTNAGDCADLVVAFNEQVVYSRIDAGALRAGTLLFLDNCWASDPDPSIRSMYAEAVEDFLRRGYEVSEIPVQEQCRQYTEDPRRGKNMWVLGMLCALYDLDMDLVRRELAQRFARKGDAVIQKNLALLEGGHNWTVKQVERRFHVPARKPAQPMVVMNGNQALGLGIMAAGIELCSMYPITPATSASHFLASVFEQVGGFVHQAEDEIAAIGFAIGASYAGKTAVTITSGPGLALKTEFLGLAVMAEIPLVVVVVQRGGPSTGLPTKIEQGDLLASLYGSPGDSPKIVLAPATIEECFHFMVLARKLAEEFRGPVIVLSDANLATGQQPFPRPSPSLSWLAPPVDQNDWNPDVPPFAWDPKTGLSKRPVPGQKGGEYVLTGLAHDEHSHVAYESAINQRAMEMRSRKLAVLRSALRPPAVHGDAEGDLLVVGWGSTLGAIEEAVDRLRAEGWRVSSLHLRFLSPLEPGLPEIFARFRRVMTVEINYSDTPGQPYIEEGSRRYAQLATLLRAQTLVDVDCWSRVPGSPLPPGAIVEALRPRLEAITRNREVESCTA
ncbi:MAG: 2-oxoacid:acceptor oxidoreductase subunit alpha [Bryobacteraceae bacterium]|nr:2-oxoacid:acceptor oxidoreductase subunit alpha [Bryobacteraceae bacterium]MDW8376670.1 2-oxoacid:acceptor oxidoreductase subunit alpha [Bryobacterales bacterium]